MSLKTRILRLEKRQGLRSIRPPIEFFDRILNGSASEKEWQRWKPWLIRNNLVSVPQEASEHPDQDCNQELGGGPEG